MVDRVSPPRIVEIVEIVGVGVGVGPLPGWWIVYRRLGSCRSCRSLVLVFVLGRCPDGGSCIAT
jgi:hypothetical protein